MVVRIRIDDAISGPSIGMESKVTAPFNAITIDARMSTASTTTAVIKLVTGFFIW